MYLLVLLAEFMQIQVKSIEQGGEINYWCLRGTSEECYDLEVVPHCWLIQGLQYFQ